MLDTIIIGNGPSAIKRPIGKVIDKHENVVRINHFLTKGYEEFLGRRATTLACCAKYFNAQYPASVYREVIFCSPFWEEHHQHGVQRHVDLVRKECELYGVDFHRVPPAIVQRVRKEMEDAVPSTGLLTIAEFCYRRQEKVRIVGFDCFEGADDKTKPYPHHYWQPSTRMLHKQRGHHTPAKERAWLQRLVDQGWVHPIT